MPITGRQFELGVNDEIQTLMVRVYELLRKDVDLAYSRAEIADALGLPTVLNPLGARYEAAVESQSNLREALAALLRLNGAAKRTVRREEYYRASQELNTETWKRKETSD
jgi:hypothetical protein